MLNSVSTINHPLDDPSRLIFHPALVRPLSGPANRQLTPSPLLQRTLLDSIP